jgi:tRNA/rRNA methyltransferase
MAGTNRRRVRIAEGPSVILVQPQLGENIGTAARAMLNCGLGDLRLVKPRDGWPSDKAINAASGADVVVNGAKLFGSIADAAADIRHLYAATARDRHMVKRILTPRAAAAEMRQHMAAGETCGVLFGPERTGLTSDQTSLAETIITVPLNPAFSSLNLAQAVLLMGYEWFLAGDATPDEQLHVGQSRPATQEEFERFFDHLEEELIVNGFLRERNKRPSMVRNLRSLFLRAQCTEQELRTLHGVVTAFAGPRNRPGKKKPAE